MSWPKGKKRLDMIGKPSPMKGKKHTPEAKHKNREKHLGKKCPEQSVRMKQNNPLKCPKLRDKQRQRMQGNKNPMKRPEIAIKTSKALIGKKKSWLSKLMNSGKAAYMCSCNKSPSKEQVQLFERVKLFHPLAVLNYQYQNFCIDIAIPEFKIAIEFDGYFWHRGREEKDRKRQKEIEKGGWKFLRYNKLPNSNDLNDGLKKILSREKDGYTTLDI